MIDHPPDLIRKRFGKGAKIHENMPALPRIVASVGFFLTPKCGVWSIDEFVPVEQVPGIPLSEFCRRCLPDLTRQQLVAEYEERTGEKWLKS